MTITILDNNKFETTIEKCWDNEQFIYLQNVSKVIWKQHKATVETILWSSSLWPTMHLNRNDHLRKKWFNKARYSQISDRARLQIQLPIIDSPVFVYSIYRHSLAWPRPDIYLCSTVKCSGSLISHAALSWINKCIPSTYITPTHWYLHASSSFIVFIVLDCLNFGYRRNLSIARFLFHPRNSWVVSLVIPLQNSIKCYCTVI